MASLDSKPSYGNILLESLDSDFDQSIIANFKELREKIEVPTHTELDENLLDPTELKVDRKI